MSVSVPASAQPPRYSAALSRIFEEAVLDLKKNIPWKEVAYFESVNFQEVEDTIEKIQLDQKSREHMRDFTRIWPFLDAMCQYEKFVEVHLNRSNLFTYLWGPIKRLLTISSTFMDAFEWLLSAYEDMGECLPLYSQYEEYFQSNPHMWKMLGYVYKDILIFHARVYKIMSGSMWKTVFAVTSSSIQAALAEIRTNFLRHKDLVEKQPNLLYLDAYLWHREAAELRFQQEERMEIRRQQMEIRRQQMEILEWLAMTSTETTPASTDQEHYASKRKDYPTSGQWLQTCRAYQEWINPDIYHLPVIWLYGIPGAGKTVLASEIIEQACKVPEFTVGWFYCKFGNKDKSTLLGVLRGIIAQLVNANDQLRPYILEAKNKTGDLKLISPQVAKELMAECLQVLEKTCIIIDGLDECDEDARREIATLFTRLARLQNDKAPGSLRILFVSTDEYDIRRSLSKAVAIVLRREDTCLEMEIYVRTWVRKIQELHALTDLEMEEIVARVMKSANGMYLYCYLLLNKLHCQSTREDLDHTLQPDTLDFGATYDKFLYRININSRRSLYATKVLAWLACSKRPLKWHEIQGALAVGISDGTFDLQRRSLRVSVKELCGALVELQPDETVQFAHTTAREYIICHHYQSNQFIPREPWIDISEARLQAALTCVVYLGLSCFSINLTDDEMSLFVEKGYYCFQDYAVVYWYDHVEGWFGEATETAAGLNTLISALSMFLERNWNGSAAVDQVEPEETIWARVSQRLKVPLDQSLQIFRKLTVFACSQGKNPCPGCPASLFLNFEIPVRRARALIESEGQRNKYETGDFRKYYGHNLKYFKCTLKSCFQFSAGFPSLSERDEHELLHRRGCSRCSERTGEGYGDPFDKPDDISASHCLATALIVAIEMDHRDLVRLMLDQGADIINATHARTTALIAAIENGRSRLVPTLLDRGANVNTTNWQGTTPLMAAAAGGHTDIISHLLDRGADINATHGRTTALIAAIEKGHSGIVLLLLDRGANLNTTNCQGTTPLMAAAARGHTDVMSLLLHRGAEIDTTKRGGGALIAAAAKGHRDLVLLLLDGGADITATENGDSALSVAAAGDHKHVVSLLLERGGALMMRAEGYTEVMAQLLDRGPDMNVSHGETTTLVATVETGRIELLSLLLDQVVDINAAQFGTTALIAAVEKGHRNIVTLLLDRGADINATHGRTTALIAAVEKGHRDIVTLLLDRGADINATDGRTSALITAVEGGDRDTMKKLLEPGVDINMMVTNAPRSGTALIAAVVGGSSMNKDIVEMLLNLGADINATPNDARDTYGTALIAAAARARTDIVSLLLDRGANVNTIACSRYSAGTALIAAAARGHEDIVSLLLDRGAGSGVNIVDESSEYGTALNAALSVASKGHAADKPAADYYELVLLLLEHGADVNTVTGDYGSALGIAAYEDSKIYVSLLLDHKADIYHVGGKYQTATGGYPTALDAAYAGAHARGKPTTEGASRLLLQRIRTNTARETTPCPPFPMPFTGTYQPPSTHLNTTNVTQDDILLDHIHAGYNLLPEQADYPCATLGKDALLTGLVALVGIDTEAVGRGQGFIQNDIRFFISQGYDLGLAYAACRVAWKDFNAPSFNVSRHRGRWHKEAEGLDVIRDAAIYLNEDTGQELIRSPYQVMPRRIWDVKSNRVVEFRMVHSDVLARGCGNRGNDSTLCPDFWAVTHSWTNSMNPIDTSINQYQWPVPLPQDVDLNRDLRKELLDFKAEYVWIDVLCLRQHSPIATATQMPNDQHSLEGTRALEWKLDVPTIGNIYRAATGLVRYFNGLGRLFSIYGWDDSRHWLQRAWTLQEIKSESTTVNGGIRILRNGASGHNIMGARGTIDGNPITLRRAIRSVVKLAAEVDTSTGCCMYDLAREMAKRHSTMQTDKVAGLLYLLRITQLPTYNENISDEDAWGRCVHVLPLERKIEILCDFPYRGADHKDQWFPTWKQLLEWPERDPEYVHIRSVWPQNDNHLDLVEVRGAETFRIQSASCIFVPDIWAISDVVLREANNYGQYEVNIEDKVFSFYCPYLHQTPIELGPSSRFTLATVSLGNSNNWVVCKMSGLHRGKCKSKDGKETITSIKILRKVGVLATDACSELFVHSGTSSSRLKKINCVFE